MLSKPVEASFGVIGAGRMCRCHDSHEARYRLKLGAGEGVEGDLGCLQVGGMFDVNTSALLRAR